MNWKRIPKENSVQPSTGTYKDWKEPLSEEGFFQCVYCAIHESNFGGIRNFHVEHYKPKSKKRFRKLENDILNLFYACSICNCFKSDDWPKEPNGKFDGFFYPNPSKIDYSKLFDVLDNGVIVGLNITGIYIINKLYLNRPQLILERKQHQFNNKLEEIIKRIKVKEIKLLELAKDNSSNEYIMELIIKLRDSIYNLILLLNSQSEIRPYLNSQIKKS